LSKKIVLKIIFGWLLFPPASLFAVAFFSLLFENDANYRRIDAVIGVVIFTALALLGLKLIRSRKKQKGLPVAQELHPEESQTREDITTVQEENKTESFQGTSTAPPPIKAELPESDEELPEDWAYRKVMENYEPESALFHIEYVGAEGKESSRDIQILRFEESNDRLSLYAYCHLAKAMRQFIADRVVSISFNGQEMDDPQAFLWDTYKNSNQYKTQQALEDHIDEILALVFLARADGKMLKNEREVICRYIDIIVPGIDAEAVEKMIRKASCDLAEFNKILKRAKYWRPYTKKMIIGAASQIIALKKHLDPMEKATFEKLEKEIA